MSWSMRKIVVPSVEEARAGEPPATGSPRCRGPAAGSSSSSSFGAAASARATPTSLRWPWDRSLGRRRRRRPGRARRAPCRPLLPLAPADGWPEEVEQERVPRRLLGGDEQVVAHAEVLEQLERLERARHPEMGPPSGRDLLIDAVEEHLAAETVVNPVIASTNVVLPAPFGPIRPTSVPASTLEVDLVVGGQTAVSNGQSAGLEQGHQTDPARSLADSTGGGRSGGRPCVRLALAMLRSAHLSTIERMNRARTPPSDRHPELAVGVVAQRPDQVADARRRPGEPRTDPSDQRPHSAARALTQPVAGVPHHLLEHGAMPFGLAIAVNTSAAPPMTATY